jgi:ribosomal protein S10
MMCAVLASCATIPVSSIYKLRNFDLATTDVSKLRVAVQIPQSIRVRPAGVTMVVAARLENDSLNQQEAFVLEELATLTGAAEQQPKPAKWTQVAAYRLKSADTDRITAFREKIAQLKQRHGDEVKGSISIGIDSCARTLIADGPVLITTWIKSEETVEYVVLNRNLDLRRESEMAGQVLEIKPCQN